MKIALIGRDKQGWSVDKDNFYTSQAIKALDFQQTKNVFSADIIFSVWYSLLVRKKNFYLKFLKNRKKIVAVITNNIEDNIQDFSPYNKIVDYWVCANSIQKEYLLKQKINPKNIFFNPFYVDEKKFFKIEKNKKEIAETLNIDYNKLKNKFLIASFQRDSLGKDLTKQKWHKNPQKIIDVLKKIDTENILLLLAGPRRHFIINQCKKNNIPYFYVGDETFVQKMTDDVAVNILSEEKINLLYNLSDLYLVTSVSEGGPKSVTEASLTKTAILSTKVGMAADMLNEFSICKNDQDFISKINQLKSEQNLREKLIENNYKKVSEINNFEAYKNRIKNIIETVAND